MKPHGRQSRHLLVATVAATAFGTVGCASTTAMPALREAETGLDEIQALVRSLTGVDRIQLSDSAFVTSPVLALQPAATGPDARLATGRLESPLRFQLTTDGTRCWLTQVGSEARYFLTRTPCRPAP